jgi:hypothetical protein
MMNGRELENTVVLYCADHGDFAGDHGLFHKNFGIYDSIHRIPFALRWPGGPSGMTCDAIVESVDWYPTLCNLCDIPIPDCRDGCDLVTVVNGVVDGKDAAFCEWDWANPASKVSAIRTRDFRLVFYGGSDEGELYGHRSDPGEIVNVWGDPDYGDVRFELLAKLMRFTLEYRTDTGWSSREKGLINGLRRQIWYTKANAIGVICRKRIQRRPLGRRSNRTRRTRSRLYTTSHTHRRTGEAHSERSEPTLQQAANRLH